MMAVHDNGLPMLRIDRNWIDGPGGTPESILGSWSATIEGITRGRRVVLPLTQAAHDRIVQAFADEEDQRERTLEEVVVPALCTQELPHLQRTLQEILDDAPLAHMLSCEPRLSTTMTCTCPHHHVCCR